MNQTAKSSTSLMLVDGSSYLYRAFHALPPLNNSRGEPTGAVYGVINMLRRLVDDYRSEHIAVVFDAKGKTFRDDMFAAYKAHRPSMPNDLAAQIEPLHQVVEALGFPILQVTGVEADDVIATLARQAAAAGWNVVISTGDKDLAQLVNERITLVNTMTGTTLDRAGVINKFGIPPERIIDYLALVGDSSDNIPGVPKVGPKTAVKWLIDYGSLDDIVAQAGQISGKVGESLRDNLPQLELSRQLATVKDDVELPMQIDQLKLRPPQISRLRQLYAHLEFKGLLRQLEDTPDRKESSAHTEAGIPANATNSAVDSPVSPLDYVMITSEAVLNDWLARLEQAEIFAFDTETDCLDYNKANIVGVSFAVQLGEAAYVPLAHDYPGVPDQLGRTAVLERMRPLLEDPRHGKVGQHLKYDMNVLANHGIRLAGVRHDTMLESYVLNAAIGRHDMDSMALRELGRTTITFQDVAGKGAKQLTFNQVDLETASRYAAEDAEVTLALHHKLWPRLQAEPGMRRIYEDIEIPLVPILSGMEQTGVKIDAALLKVQSRQLEARMTEIADQAYQEAGAEFNLASPKQLQEILYDKLGLPVRRKTPTGQPSTAEDVLAELAESYALPRLILDYRTFAKLKSTYTDKLPAQINPRTGRVHTSYHQAVAATGRLSSTDPNLQNIPIRTPEGRRIRAAFIAPAGQRILSADYSQIELRIMAHLSGDAGLLAAFASGEDVHRRTAAEVFGVSPDEVTADQRRSAKAINFGLIYGMSAFGLARQLGIDRGSAQTYVDRYFQRYPGVRDFMDRTRRQAKENGYVETVYGRRLYIPDINASNGQHRQYAERTAINAPMQGTAADIIKRAMINIDRVLKTSDLPARMIMQVHDELVFEVAETQADALKQMVIEQMIAAGDLKVPLEVDVGVGNNWDEAH